MKVGFMKGAALAAALFLCCGHAWNSSPAPGGTTQERKGAGGKSGSETSQAAALFAERCARCHGRDGRGRTKLGEMLAPPDFADGGWQKGVSDERLRDSIRDGRGEMPAFAKKLSRREIAALAAYVRGFAKPDR